ncbi:MAG: methyltransferase domain-containing protein [Planctomycetota bacterium]
MHPSAATASAACLVLLVGIGPAARGQEPAAAVPAGINDRFKDPELNVSEWIGRFEVESREVFAARAEVLKACDVRPGETVADVGAGTGFYSQLFAQAVGRRGRVFAVDIAPKFLDHIEQRTQAEGLLNLTTVRAAQDSVRLAPESVDLVFVCDTYHHFESPQRSLASIFRCLRPGGRLVVIDFERVPGVTREWLLGHVRAGKEVFRQEIVDAGFVLRDEVRVEGFKENYLLRFKRPRE